MKALIRGAACVVLLLLPAAAACGDLPSDAAIRTILATRIGDQRGVGIVVGILSPHGRRIIASGGVDGDSVFEIGSVTKVFTALLLADMVQRGEVRLDDPVAKYLPSTIRIPERNGRSITLLDLATHTSGLPFMTDQPLDQFLAGFTLSRDIGTEWEYSNIGYRLLGDALAARAGTDFETLLRTRIIDRLNLHGTAITASPAMKKRIAAGHDANGQPAPAMMTVPLYAGMAAAGGLMSTANDLLTFLTAMLDDPHSPLASAAAAMLATRRPKGAGSEQALGWVVTGKGDDTLITHDGGTLGYASSVVWDPRARIGVVVLENEGGDVSDIARHLLRPDVPLAPPPVRHKEITLDAALLDRYTGRYDAPGEGTFVIARDGSRLTIESPPDWGLPKLLLRPESPRDFFASELPLRVTFESDAIVIYPPRGQKSMRAIRH